MRIGIALTSPDGTGALTELTDQMRQAADDGFSSAWISNIFGLDAVELKFNSGKRALIGTDDADNLVAAVSEALRAAHD